jgi:Lar family restriction alleviation protein
MSTDSLLPCPFCGSNKIWVVANGLWIVKCSECLSQTGFKETKEIAFQEWNTRAALSPPQAVDEKGIDYKKLGEFHRSIAKRAKELWPWDDINSKNYRTAFDMGAKWLQSQCPSRSVKGGNNQNESTTSHT